MHTSLKKRKKKKKKKKRTHTQGLVVVSNSDIRNIEYFRSKSQKKKKKKKKLKWYLYSIPTYEVYYQVVMYMIQLQEIIYKALCFDVAQGRMNRADSNSLV